MSCCLASLGDIHVRIGQKSILSGVDLSVYSGEVLAILGPNGAGKSTLLKVLAGVIAQQEGVVELAENAECSQQTWARTVAYLPQSFVPHWQITVRDLIGLGRSRGCSMFSRPSLDVAFDDLTVMKIFDLEHLKDRMVQTLSGGEQARVGLAWALVGGAKVLAADEPIAALDPAHQINTLKIFRGLRQTLSTVVVMHDINLALRFADRIAIIADGKCVVCLPADELAHSSILDQVFHVPFVRCETSEGLLLVPPRDELCGGFTASIGGL